jgi:D-alanyl-lipoteichoic acid acyltransferase DltB (MBOAT superfamily)
MIEEGVWLMIWGMFKKVVLADNLAPLVDVVYNSSAASPGALIVLGTIAFGFQIYCDFSGYSDIARGTAKILGFDIMINFNLPYFAASLREFWQRWHISLSSWLRDYLYISLGGNRRGRFRTYRNLFLTMLLGGLWHGAAWNFLLWGVWHGSALVLERLALPRPGQKSLSPRTPQPPVRPPGGHALCIRAGTGRTAIEKIREILARLIPIKLTVRASVNLWTLSRLLSWAISMLVVFYGWLLFRAGSLDQILYLTTSLSDFSMPVWIQSYALNLAAFVLPLVLIQLLQYHSANLLAPLAWRPWARGLLQGLLLIGVLIYWEKKGSPFIYFQF